MIMANLDFYRSKVAELKLRLQWIKDSVNVMNNGHDEIQHPCVHHIFLTLVNTRAKSLSLLNANKTIVPINTNVIDVGIPLCRCMVFAPTCSADNPMAETITPTG